MRSRSPECWSWGLGHFGVLGRTFTPYDHDSAAALAGFGGEDDEREIVAAIDRALVVPQEYNIDNLMAHLDMIANLSLVDSSDQCIPKKIDSLEGIKIIGASAGHRHSLMLDDKGSLYSCGAGTTGCLGHGDTAPSSHPMKIRAFGK